MVMASASASPYDVAAGEVDAGQGAVEDGELGGEEGALVGPHRPQRLSQEPQHPLQLLRHVASRGGGGRVAAGNADTFVAPEP